MSHANCCGRETYEVDRILVASYDGCAEMILCGSTQKHNLHIETAPNLSGLLDEDAQPATKPIERVTLLAKRLVVGLLFAMQSRENVKERTVKSSRRFEAGRRVEEPEHRIVIVGHPLTVDCREAVTSYIEKGRYEKPRQDSDSESSVRRGPPAYLVLVRGHRRRQVCGVGRLQRKVIWIESFWRGPEGAPILTRPKRIVGKPKVAE